MHMYMYAHLNVWEAVSPRDATRLVRRKPTGLSFAMGDQMYAYLFV